MEYPKHILLAVCMAVLVLFSTCNIINPDEIIPAYITVQPFTFTTDPDQGTSSSLFTDAWVSINGQVVGTYELPATFPVWYSDGRFQVSVAPGIKVDGIGATRDIYEVCRAWVDSLTLTAQDTVVISPSTRYLDQIDFSLIEDFEIGNSFTSASDSDGDFVIVEGVDVFEGTRSASIELGSLGYFFHGVSELKELPRGSTPVYLELDYKGTAAFDVFLNAISTLPGGTSVAKYLVTVSPREDWNKIYVRLNDDIANLPDAEYQVAFRAFGSDDVEGKVFLDNIKLVHF